MMCKEMLETRLMLKRAMKKHKGAGGSESVLQKVLDARQLAVKLLSNVTCKPNVHSSNYQNNRYKEFALLHFTCFSYAI